MKQPTGLTSCLVPHIAKKHEVTSEWRHLMRLISRHRHSHRAKAPRISISQAEITADLIYPASPRAARRQGAGTRTRGAAR